MRWTRKSRRQGKKSPSAQGDLAERDTQLAETRQSIRRVSVELSRIQRRLKQSGRDNPPEWQTNHISRRPFWSWEGVSGRLRSRVYQLTLAEMFTGVLAYIVIFGIMRMLLFSNEWPMTAIPIGMGAGIPLGFVHSGPVGAVKGAVFGAIGGSYAMLVLLFYFG